MAARSLTSTPATCHRRRATTGRPRRVRLLAVALAAAAVTASAACGSGTGAASGPTEVEFFQFKGEAVQTFDKLIAKFNAENPDIHVTQNPSPDGEIGLRMRLVKNKVPDVMSLNVNGSFGEFSTAGIFYDFSKDPVVDTVTPGSVKILTDLGRGGAARSTACRSQQRRRRDLQQGPLREVRPRAPDDVGRADRGVPRPSRPTGSRPSTAR